LEEMRKKVEKKSGGGLAIKKKTLEGENDEGI